MLLLLSACGGGSKTSSAFKGEILPLKYAENLTLIQGEGYTEAVLRNPWDTPSNRVLKQRPACGLKYPRAGFLHYIIDTN